MKFEEIRQFARKHDQPSFAGIVEDILRWSSILPRAFDTKASVRKILLATSPLDIMRTHTIFGEGCGILGREFRMMDLVSRMMFAKKESTIDRISAQISALITAQFNSEENYKRRQHEAHEAYKRDQEVKLKQLRTTIDRIDSGCLESS
jgi:hypothetical protein